MSNPPQIAIVGAGFGGLASVIELEPWWQKTVLPFPSPRRSRWRARFGRVPVRSRVLVVVLFALMCAFAAAAGDARAETGALTQKPGLAGCVSETGSGGVCVDGTGLDGAFSMAVSPDGRSVYAASVDSDAVVVLDRAADGTVTQKPGTAGCMSEIGSGGQCADGTGLDGASSVAVSPDGRSVYVAGLGSSAVVVFDRAADGTVTQKPGTAGCISDDGSGGQCVDGTALEAAESVAVSPDGRSVYAASFASGAVVVLDRAADGTLTQKPGTAGCVSDTGSGGACVDGTALEAVESVAVSPDGRSVYAASPDNDAVVVLDRAADGTVTQKPGTAGCISEIGSGGQCGDGTALDGAFAMAVSPDGHSVYVASPNSDAVVVFDRAADGVLTQKPGRTGCVSDDGSGGECADGTALDGASSVAVSPDGRSVYVTSSFSDAVVVLDRAADGTLIQKPGTAGCVSDTGSGAACVDGTGLEEASSVAVSPDGRSVYAASFRGNAVGVFDREPVTPVVPGPGTQSPGPEPVVRFAAELQVTRGRIRSNRRLDVVAPISARASGAVNVRFRAAGRTKRFTVAVDEARDRVRFRRRLSRSQARTGRGVLMLAYRGDADTRPQRVRLRVGPRAARLRAGRPRIQGGRLRARGRIAKRARGFVRVQLSFQAADARVRTLRFKARVRHGAYRVNARLSAKARDEIAHRLSPVHAATLYAGHARRKIRGELRSHQVTVDP